MMATTQRKTPLKIAQLEVWRGTSSDSGKFQIFDVPFEPGESVLDGLVRIRMEKDPSLAVRFSCFNANVCKECTMLIDGEVQYACIAKLTAEKIRIEPLPKRTVIRDLVTDTLSKKEKL